MKATKLYILRRKNGSIILSSERIDVAAEGRYLLGGEIEKIYYDPQTGRKVDPPEPDAVEV